MFGESTEARTSTLDLLAFIHLTKLWIILEREHSTPIGLESYLVSKDTAQSWSDQCIHNFGYCLIFMHAFILIHHTGDRQLPQNNMYEEKYQSLKQSSTQLQNML